MHKGNFLHLLQEDLLIQKFTKVQKHNLFFDFTSLLTLRVFQTERQAQTDQALNELIREKRKQR